MGPAGYGSRVEGVHAVAAAAGAGRVIRLTVEEGRSDRPEVREILTSVDPSIVTRVADVREVAESQVPQGVVAECRPIMPVSLDSLAGSAASVVVLDHVADPQNLGAVARSAAAAGVRGLVVSSRRSAPLSAVAFKAAAGALERLPVAIVGSIPDAISRLRDSGLWAVGLDAGGDQSLFGLELLGEPVAVVIGGEGPGLSVLARKRCDVMARIPMAPGSESLNVSISSALAVFEIMRVRSQAADSRLKS